MKPITIQAEPEIKSGIWDFKYKRAKEKIKESFWGDFLFGGLLVSGIFIFVDNLNLPQEVNITIGIINICLALSLMLGRLGWPKIIHYRINKMMGKANISYGIKQYNRSIRYLDKIIEIDPKIKEAWLNKGYATVNSGREEEAIECYDKAIEIDPKYKEAWLNKGYAIDNLGREEEAIECYDKALEIDPIYIRAWFNKGYSLAKLGSQKEAIECYDKALEIDPKIKEAWINKGNILAKLGRQKEAIE